MDCLATKSRWLPNIIQLWTCRIPCHFLFSFWHGHYCCWWSCVEQSGTSHSFLNQWEILESGDYGPSSLSVDMPCRYVKPKHTFFLKWISIYNSPRFACHDNKTYYISKILYNWYPFFTCLPYAGYRYVTPTAREGENVKRECETPWVLFQVKPTLNDHNDLDLVQQDPIGNLKITNLEGYALSYHSWYVS